MSADCIPVAEFLSMPGDSLFQHRLSLINRTGRARAFDIFYKLSHVLDQAGVELLNRSQRDQNRLRDKTHRLWRTVSRLFRVEPLINPRDEALPERRSVILRALAHRQ